MNTLKLLVCGIAITATFLISTPHNAQAGEAVFLKFGRTLDQAPDSISKKDKLRYRQALEKYPSAVSCIQSSSNTEKLQKQPLNWKNITTLHELEVCVFKVTNYLKNLDDAEEWLSNSGLNYTYIPQSEAVMRFHQQSDSGHLLSCIVPRDKIQMSVKWYTLLGVHNLAVGLILNNEGMPVDVNATFTRQ